MIAKLLVLAGILTLVFYFYKFKNKKDKEKENELNTKKEVKAVELKEDIICCSFVEETTKYKVKLYDKVYYFCSEECKNKFIEEHSSN